MNLIRRGVSHADCILNILENYFVDITKVFWISNNKPTESKPRIVAKGLTES